MPYTYSVNYSEKNKKLLQIYWSTIVCISLAELLDAILYLFGIIELPNGLKKYLITFFIIPESINVLLGLIGTIAYKKWNFIYPKRICYLLLTFFLITAHVAIRTHYEINVLYISYAMIIFLSLIYSNSKITKCLSVASIISYFSILKFVLPYRDPITYQYNYVDVVTTVIMIALSMVISMYLLETYRDLIEKNIDINMKKNHLEHELKLDSLTGLYNHAMFYENLDHAIESYYHSIQPFSVVVIDIDDFKKANDIYGHSFGDHVILKLVDVINEYLPESGFAHRYGGEEFALILYNNAKESMEVAERIRKSFQELQFDIQPQRVFTVSIGVCEFDDQIRSGNEVFTLADQTLYDAKKSGKNKVLVYKGD